MNNPKIQKATPENFNTWVKKGINLLGGLGKEMDDRSAISLLVDYNIPRDEAIEILLFLPIAFCRKLLPQVKWREQYIVEVNDNSQLIEFYSENIRYIIIEKETDVYWNNDPIKSVVLNVAARSAEFCVINELLLKGGKLEEIQLTKTLIKSLD